MSRQTAVECLFYLSYHTQLTVEEVVALIDLIKELTNGAIPNKPDGGLPLLDPLLRDIPSPYEALDSSSSGISSPWPLPQQQTNPYNNFYGANQQWNLHTQPPAPKLKNGKEWEREWITSLWKRGQPQLLRCVSTLIMSVICAFDARHRLMNRESHGINPFGAGNALFPPQDHVGSNTASSMNALQPIHSRLDPNSASAEESWNRRDIWGLLLVPYALLLRSAASQLMSPRGSPVHPRSPVGGGIDVKNTFSKCLMVASQLKSLTFARMSLIPSLGMPSNTTSSTVSGSSSDPASSSVFEFYASTMAEFTAQYIDALGYTGNLPITRKDWLDDEVNLAQSEWLEQEQKRQFGVWAGREEESAEDADTGPRKVDIMNRPDCLEDVFALVSSVCEVYPAGARSFWYVGEEPQQSALPSAGNATPVSPHATSSPSCVVLAPSRALQTLDLLQSDSESSLFVYLSFLASLALSDGPNNDRNINNGASMIHSYLSGQRTINHTDGRHMHFLWSTIIGSIRWYAENLSQDEEDLNSKKTSATSPADRIRHRSNSATDSGADTSTSYYYMASDSGASSGVGDASSSSKASDQDQPASNNSGNNDSKTKELDEMGRNTLMALLCLISNVASKCFVAREFILGIQLPATMEDGDGNANATTGYQDGSLEILFSLLTIPTLSPDIRGMGFSAIANLLHPNENESKEQGAATHSTASSAAPSFSAKNAALRTWELLELCQFVPIKLLSQYSSFAAGAGRAMPITRDQQPNNDILPSSTFPASTDYGMIYQFEHVESKAGYFPATEGFLYLLSTLVRVAGCPPSLGNQWRLRPGAGPYIEYVTDFVLPRATGMAKDVRTLEFRGLCDECRLVERALEVVEAVLVRYVVPPFSSKEKNVTLDEVKAQFKLNIELARTEMGLSSVLDIFCDVDSIDEEEVGSAIQDFSNMALPSQDLGPINPSTNQNQGMLEASFGNPVPLPKTPGFGILADILSSPSSSNNILQILWKILSQNGASKGIHTYAEKTYSKSLATSLYRETPPDLACAEEGTLCKVRKERNLVDERVYEESLSVLRQGMIPPVEPLLLLSCFERSGCPEYNYGSGCRAHLINGASLSDALHWRERSLLISLRILCAAAAREDMFMQSLKEALEALPSPLSVIPTLSFKGPIHGSFAHRFVNEEKVSVVRLSNLLLTQATSSGAVDRCSAGYRQEILPIITDYVGYGACSSMSNNDPQGISRSAFGIVSYLAHTIPQVECVHSLCGPEDMNGTRLANAFAKGLSLPCENIESGKTVDLRAAILDLILLNFNIDSAPSPNSSLNLSLIMLGLSGSSTHNCLDVIFDLVAESNDFVLDPMSSALATKCFEILFRVCQLGNTGANAKSNRRVAPNVLAQQRRWMDKLRHRNYWQMQIVRFLEMRGPSTPSIFQEVMNSFCYGHGSDLEISRRDNDVLHSFSWLLKGLALELSFLIGLHDNKSAGFGGGGIQSELASNHSQLQSIMHCLLSDPNVLLLRALVDMPLGQSSNGFIKERLHSIAAPSRDVLKASSKPMSGPVEICDGYEMIDVDRLLHLCHYAGTSPSSVSTSMENAKEWAVAWNSFVCRVCACSHISEAWSDVVRTAVICSPITMHQKQAKHFSINTKVVMDILCTILSRLLSPTHLATLGQYSVFVGGEVPTVGDPVEAESAMPLSIAALSVVDVLIESSYLDHNAISNQGAFLEDDSAGFGLAEEDVARVCALIVGAISSCEESSAARNMSPNDERAAVLSCALTRMLAFSEEASYSVISQNSTPSSILDMYANAVVYLFSLSTHPVFNSHERYKNAHDAKGGAIAVAARSGLSSLFGHLKSTEHQDSVGELFCSNVFTLETISSAVAKLVHLITCKDNDVTYLLQQIALFADGVQLLAKSSITSKLLEFAMVYAQEEQHFLSSNIGTNGARQLEPPSLLVGHLSLINALLSSPLVSSDRVALAVDSIQLLKVYCSTFERLLLSYPSNDNLMVKFIESLTLAYTVLKRESAGSNALGNILLSVDDSLLSLENNVLRIAYQLSAFPFPSHMLPPLPMELIDVEKIHTSQLKNIRVNLGNESTWWDNINPETSSSEGGLSLPSPPAGSTSDRYGIDPIWSERKYQYAISSAKCLEMSILFLISRVHFLAERESSTFCIDAVAIAKGICRCSDASMAIEGRLSVISRPEIDMTKMFDSSNVMDVSRSDQPPLSHVLRLERECLLQLGSALGRCAEKLMCLALQEVRRMATRSLSSNISKTQSVHEWAYFIGAMTPALEHTEMETKGVGCAFSGETAEGSKLTAQALRQEVDRVKTLIK